MGFKRPEVQILLPRPKNDRILVVFLSKYRFYKRDFVCHQTQSAYHHASACMSLSVIHWDCLCKYKDYKSPNFLSKSFDNGRGKCYSNDNPTTMVGNRYFFGQVKFRPEVMPRKADESYSPNSRRGEIPRPPVQSEWERSIFGKSLFAHTFDLSAQG